MKISSIGFSVVISNNPALKRSTMDLVLSSPSPSSSLLTFSSKSSFSSSSSVFLGGRERINGGLKVSAPIVKATVERSGETLEGGTSGDRQAFSAVEVRTFDGEMNDNEFPVWDKLGAIVRLSYGVGIYGAMALAGKFICEVSGIDCLGGFHPSLDAILNGLGFAAPPIMALLFILDDEVVKLSPHARAIRDVEDEELRSFFYGMSPWQFLLIVAASSVGEELFYRAAVQGALADIFLRGTEFVKDERGIACLTGMLPPFVPFAQAFAAVTTAALTASLYYVAASPKDPTYVVAPVLRSRSGREDLKKLFAGSFFLTQCIYSVQSVILGSVNQDIWHNQYLFYLCSTILSLILCFSSIILHWNQLIDGFLYHSDSNNKQIKQSSISRSNYPRIIDPIATK